VPPRALLQLVAAGIIATVLLAYGIDRASVGTPYSDPITRLRAQDESSYANSALRFARDGGWLTPKVLGRYQLNKPPLLVWLAGLSIKILGQSLWTLRLPALAAAVIATLIVFWWSRNSRSALVACGAFVLLLSNPLWHIFARLCYTDMLVAAFTTAAMAILYFDPALARKQTLWGFAACVAACVMAKSIAGLIPLLILAAYCLLAGRDHRPAFKRVALVVLASTALFAPWHIYELAVHRQWFWADYVQVQLLGWGTQPPGQNTAQSALVFYFSRLFKTDPVLSVLFVTSLPSLILALLRRRALPALLVSWFTVVTAALILHSFENLPYALSLVPPACLIVAIYHPLFAPRIAKWTVFALCAVFIVKCVQPQRVWRLSFGAAEPLDAVAVLRSYYALGRPNELILADSDDFFYASTLPLPRIRYYFRVHDDVLRNFIPHYVHLGIMLTEDEFEQLPRLAPVYAARLKAWGLDSTEPIGTAILGTSDDALLRLIQATPRSDFYITSPDAKLLDQVAPGRSILKLPNGNLFLLAPAVAGDPIPEKPPALPARW